MNARVVIRQQVHDFIAGLAPVPRRKLWLGIKGLPKSKGDVIQLEGNLSPFFRLRVDKIRVVFEERSVGVSGC